jgi:hypothetical protein
MRDVHPLTSETTFRYQLIVNDGTTNSKPSFVDITMLPLIIEIKTNRDQIDAPPATNAAPADTHARLSVTVKNIDQLTVRGELVRFS